MNKKLVGLGLVGAGIASYIYKSKRSFKAASQTIKAIRRIAKGESEFYPATVGGRNVVVQTDAVLAVASMYGVALRNGLGEPAIFIEEELLSADIDVQKFVVAHEEGHTEWHMSDDPTIKDSIKSMASNFTRRYKALFGFVCMRELEADLYAALDIGFDVAIRGLEGLRAAALERYGKGTHIKEIDNRIKALIEFQLPSPMSILTLHADSDEITVEEIDPLVYDNK